jgi:hypothetical protein
MEVLGSRILLRPGEPERSRRFYRDTLGLAVYRELGSPDGTGLAIWIQVRDLEAEHQRLLAARVPVVRAPRQEPWGLVEMWIGDPDGVPIVPCRGSPRPRATTRSAVIVRNTHRSMELAA